MSTPMHEREDYVDLCKQAGVCPHSVQVSTDSGAEETMYCEIAPGAHEDYLGMRWHSAEAPTADWWWPTSLREPA